MDKFVKITKKALIPILKPLKVESTDKIYFMYMLRLTPLGKYSREDIIKWLASFTDNWVCGKEQSKKEVEHYHITIYDEFEEEELRVKIRAFLAIYFTEPAKRGDANKQYNLAVADSVDKAVSYSIKESTFDYGLGMNEEYMTLRAKAAYVKFDKRVFAEELETLKESFRVSLMSLEDFMITFTNLKAKYRQPINMNNIYSLALSCQCNRDPGYAEGLVSRFLDSKNRFS